MSDKNTDEEIEETTTTKLINPVEEYFNEQEVGMGNELFRISDDNSDIKSEVSEEELRLINVLKMNDNFLESKNLKPVFKHYYKNFLRLKVSLKRQGRGEYVDINRADNSDRTISRFGDLSNMLGNRK